MTVAEQNFLTRVPSLLHSISEQLEKISSSLEKLNSASSSIPPLPLLKEPEKQLSNKIDNPQKAAFLFRDKFNGLDHEEFRILLLNGKLEPIKEILLGIGNSSSTVIDIKRTVREAVLAGAHSLIMFHNHPSGNPVPSEADIKQTEQLRSGLKLLEICLADHIIICDDVYYSFTLEHSERF